jgi:hypothetical protein
MTTTASEAASEEPKEDAKITKESVLSDVIDDIDKLEKGLKSVRNIGDLLILRYGMSVTLSKISLQLNVLRSWLENDAIFKSQLTRNIAKRLD